MLSAGVSGVLSAAQRWNDAIKAMASKLVRRSTVPLRLCLASVHGYKLRESGAPRQPSFGIENDATASSPTVEPVESVPADESDMTRVPPPLSISGSDDILPSFHLSFCHIQPSFGHV
ncbi:uncharacterized protein UTRI_03087 [Ustilago trichophora]|uniref:Uncharacterized protein n=1 Tax=Ustilago trichophora TaxID=86804 RepID=A0A5C3E546_9BASI|nr:uncharacterized protein UTRI_03087 [Ustilago trichophora]